MGAGVSAGAKTKSGNLFKEWGVFLREVSVTIHDEQVKRQVDKLLNEYDYLFASELIRDLIGKDKWHDCLKAEFSQAGECSDLHRAIVGLKQRITITTNFDKLFEAAWQLCNPEAAYWPQVISKIDKNIFKVLRDNAEYIIKLHGTIDNPEELIFAKSEYNRKAFNDWAYRTFIETVLMTYTIIFIGFSMKDPAISYVVEMYAQRLPDARPHYIFLGGEYPDRYIELMKNVRRLFIIPYSEEKNHSHLSELLKDLGTQAGSRRREISSEEFSTVR